MPKQQPRMSTLEQALDRVTTDSAFRAHVLADGRAVQAECGLSDADWHSLCAAVARLEEELARDPLVATEVDHGEADAAGAKN